MLKRLTLVETIKFPTLLGYFDLDFYKTSYSSQPNMNYALVLRTKDISASPNLRIHSECMLSEIFQSVHCDCREQLHESMSYISKNGGILIYLNQEGRGHGIFAKIKELKLQESGMDTVEASEHLKLEVDQRSYDVVVDILNKMKIKEVNLLTNNPRKVNYLEKNGILVNRKPLEIEPSEGNKSYLKTKKNKLGHFITKLV